MPCSNGEAPNLQKKSYCCFQTPYCFCHSTLKKPITICWSTHIPGKRQNANMHSQKCYISRPGNLQIGKISQEHPQLNFIFTNLKETQNYEDTQGAFLSFLVMICYWAIMLDILTRVQNWYLYTTLHQWVILTQGLRLFETKSCINIGCSCIMFAL